MNHRVRWRRCWCAAATALLMQGCSTDERDFSGSTSSSSTSGGAASGSSTGGSGSAPSGGTGGNTGPCYAETVLSDGPKGYWRLGDTMGSKTAVDETGALHGAIQGGVTFGAISAIVGDSNTAADFDDTLQACVNVPDSELLRFGGSASITVEAWIWPDSSLITSWIGGKFPPDPPRRYGLKKNHFCGGPRWGSPGGGYFHFIQG